MRTLLFLRDAALNTGRSAREFTADFSQRGAGGLLLIHGGKRLAKP
jgi:hypothetical protein